MKHFDSAISQAHMDTEQSAYFARQLESIKTQTYDEKTRPLKLLEAIPKDTSIHPAADEVIWRSFKGIGIARFLNDYTMGNVPKANVIGTENRVKIQTFGEGFDITVHEMNQVSLTGMNLSARKAIEVRKHVEQLLNRTAVSGAPEYNLKGLLNYSGITEYTVPNDGTGSTKTWATKTPDQIIRDIRGLIDAVEVTTNGVEIPDTVYLPQAKYSHLASTRTGSSGDMTLLEFIKKNFPQITRWDYLSELTGFGAGGTDRMFCGRLTADAVQFCMPKALEFVPPQAKGLVWENYAYGRCGGVTVYYPLAFAFGDGI